MRDLYPRGGTNVANEKVLKVLVTGAGAAAPTITKGRGWGTSTRTSAGLYTITLQDIPGGALAGHTISLQGPMADLRANIVSYNASTGVLTYSTATHVAFTGTDISSSYTVAISLTFSTTVQ